MNTSSTRNTLSAALLSAALLAPAALRAQLPDGSRLEITGSGALTRLALTDPANHCWKIQSSTDLITWTTLDTCKVHNGSLLLPFDGSGRKLFYRADYDPGQQTVFSTTATALLLPAANYNYASPVLPPSFAVPPITAQDNTPAGNLTTDNGATLGRVLFYDKRLSLNHTVSCASCHQQAHGFSDPAQFSRGFAGGLTDRNSMGLAHARWYQRQRFFWDERAATLEVQVLQPIQNAVEMGMTLPALQTRLAAEPFYQDLFTRTFGSAQVTSDRIARALAQFVRSIVSVQSKYDTGAAQNFANFTPQEIQGRQLFLSNRTNCAVCHGTDNFVPGPAINNNGLENPYVDKGVGRVSGRPQDEGLFKVPSLRNIELTGPYMHDGRFSTLEQVIEHYNIGVVNHPNLSPPLRTPQGQPRRLNLTNAEKAALVAFLKTLTDTNLATDPKYSDPFNYGQ
jgi:cytochrome c peroxidase